MISFISSKMYSSTLSHSGGSICSSSAQWIRSFCIAGKKREYLEGALLWYALTSDSHLHHAIRTIFSFSFAVCRSVCLPYTVSLSFSRSLSVCHTVSLVLSLSHTLSPKRESCTHVGPGHVTGLFSRGHITAPWSFTRHLPCLMPYLLKKHLPSRIFWKSLISWGICRVLSSKNASHTRKMPQDIFLEVYYRSLLRLNHRSFLQKRIVSFIELFCKRDFYFFGYNEDASRHLPWGIFLVHGVASVSRID